MVKFKKFKVKDYFDIQSTKSFNKDKLTIPNKHNHYDYVTRTANNNGIESITGKIDNFKPNDSNTFSLGLIQMTFFYRPNPWYAGQFVRKIIPKFNFNTRQMLYFLALFQKLSLSIKGTLVRKINEVFLNSLIELPIKSNGFPDWQYMNDRIMELEHDRIMELEHYLQVTGLNDYYLTNSDKEVLNRKIETKEFKIAKSYILRSKKINVCDKGIFDIAPTNKKINANNVTFNGKYSYVARGGSNNGIKGTINYDESYLNPSNTISFGQDTATLYYQPDSYFTGDKIQILKLNNDYGKLTPEIALYIISVIKKVFSIYSWGQQSFAVDKIANLKIKLPIDKNKQIDFEYMEKYIKVIEKLTIKNVIDYKDKVIKLTDQVIN